MLRVLPRNSNALLSFCSFEPDQGCFANHEVTENLDILFNSDYETLFPNSGSWRNREWM